MDNWALVRQTLAVVFGVLVIFGMNLMLPNMMQAIQSGMIAASDQVDLTATLKSGGAFAASALERVSRVDGVRTAQGVLARPVNLPVDFYDLTPEKADKVNTLDLVGIDPAIAERTPLHGRRRSFLAPGDGEAALVTKASRTPSALRWEAPCPCRPPRGSCA